MNGNLFKSVYYACAPLLILLIFASISVLLSYLILMVAGDIVSMRKLISKATQVFLLLSIFPLRHYLKLSWSEIGFAQKTIFFNQVGRGFVLGLVTLLPVMLVLYGFDISVIDETREWTTGKVIIRVLLALLLASLISLGEEPLFSGILLASMRKRMVALLAALISATYYAAFHFVKTKTDIPYQEITVFSGFELMIEAFMNVLNPEIISAYIALFIVGLFLATIRIQYKESIGICIGCHAAWVWQIKIGKDFFNTNPDSEYYYFVSSYYDGVVGPLVSVWLALGIIGIIVWSKCISTQVS